MQPTLIILAAGMASRYGSMKQTEGFGPSGETIMDYSIYDAIRAGFGKVIFIIRKEFAEPFKNNFEGKLKGKIETEYVFQEMDSFVDAENIPEGRTKPWGTAHAMLCAADVVKEPFAVINADDFYGQESFEKAAKFLKEECNAETGAIIGYQLNKTLSDHGTVSRGVCQVNGKNELVAINERTSISKKGNIIVYEDGGTEYEVPFDSSVSMNFWCFDPSVFRIIEDQFKDFVKENKSNIKAEFFIPIIADHFIKNEGGVIKVIPTKSQWFGVTYKEDAPSVKASLDKLIDSGIYPSSLW